MNFLTLENVSRSYGEKLLFQNITLHIDKGQKIGLIAKNGTGKSTLMRVIAGKEGSEGENAKVIIRKDIRIGWLDQEPDFHPGLDVLSAVLDDKSPLVRVVKQYEKALAHPENAHLLQEAMGEMDELNAWSFESKVKELLYQFKMDDLEAKVGTLSGGQKKRLALVKILIEEPDFLIFDEPTNHLDMEMIEWLENYLSQPNITLFMVTHDRYFLENVCDSIIELEDGQLWRYSGSYSDYLEKKSMKEEVESVTYDRRKKMLKRELEWVRKSPAARTSKSKARVDSYYDRKEANDALKQNKDEMTIQIKENRLGSKILECHNLGKSYGSKKIIDGFTYKFKRKERVGIVGPNGSGKSTFLQLLTQAIQPDTGKVVVGDTIVFGHYRQEGIQLTEDKRVIDVVRDIAEVIPLEKGKEMNAAQLLEHFLFSRPQQQVYVSQLSGGERRRLYLITVLMKNPNFLILDEPTNDLDVLTLQVLEDFLEDFPGCLLVVTHDRYFMDKLVDHLFVFEGNGVIRDFLGTHVEYRMVKKREEEEMRKQASANRQGALTKESQAPKPGMNGSERNEFKKLEKDIAQAEKRKKEIMERFNALNITNDEITRLSAELGNLQETLEKKEMRWLELSERE
jgi:ATP-binding cassette subfamily F protein uup